MLPPNRNGSGVGRLKRGECEARYFRAIASMGAHMEAKPSILYVEDDHLIAVSIVLVLEDAGFEVDHAADGVAAMAKLDKPAQDYVALVTDVRLPQGIDGWQIGRRARELSPHLPVVFVSGDSAMDWAAKGVPNSVMLQKPFANAQLVTAVTSMINEAATLASLKNDEA